MKKLYFLSIISAVFILSGAGCSQAPTINNPPSAAVPNTNTQVNTNPNGPDFTPANNNPAPTTVAPTPKTVEVSIANFAFSPATITINAGDTVKWINNDTVPHKVASNPHPTHTDLPGLTSGILQQGDSYSFTYVKKGTWGYHCHLHPSMTGQVIVQ